ncbi:caspase, EACC1-associated type [Nonomuraea sp. SYSU D8015]|uniref:caspase, EACC1-associated type n=1 Tax=Nonomuraea sp. SYSU D8015 TaxID=2593644 RepID=UPI00166103FF|nr:caspase family protein [Nonomuraea sp. SYSU D8015]
MTEDESTTLETTRVVRPRRDIPPLLLSSDGARVLVAGTGAHRPSSRLPEVPAVPSTVNDVAQALVERAGLPQAGLTVLLDPATPANLGEALEKAAREATSVLVFYYVGHGVFTPDGELHLATRATVDLAQGVPGYQALPYSVVRGILSKSPAELVVVVLDCCFTGGGRPMPTKAMDRVFEGLGRSAYVLASSCKDENGWALPGVRHTALSGALLRLLNEGEADGPPAFTLDQAYHRLAQTLPGAGFPKPRRQATDVGDRPPLAANPAHKEPVKRSNPPMRSPGDLSSPYRGLAAYGPEHAELFFGRDELTGSLTRRVRQALRAGGPPVVIGSQAFETGGPLVLTGPSGCGKSSVLRAGLIPALRQAGDEASCVVLAPGVDPLGTLARELAALGGGDPARFRAILQSDPAAARRLVPGRLLLVVDQFEEVFTACADAVARRRFTEALTELSRSAAVVIAVRAEFFGRCAAYPGLVETMRRPEIVMPMTEAELREVIEQPAIRSGLSLEPGLTDLILEDLRAEEAALERAGGLLPLLSHALLATWQRRSGGVLTMAGYRSAGGVTGAVAMSAEDTLRGLGAEFEPLARDLLLRLVRVDDQLGGTSQRVTLAELAPEAPSVGGQVMAELVRSRLVVVAGGEAELSHEALIRAWPRLGGWIDARRAGLLVRHRLAEDAAAWRREGEDPALLYTDSRLATAQAMVAALPAPGGPRPATGGPAGARGPARPGAPVQRGPGDGAITDVERAFLAASRRRQRRRSTISRAVIAALSVLLLAALSGGGLALWQSAQSNTRAGAAATQRDQALSRQLAMAAATLPDTSLAAQLALSAYRISPTAEARGALLGTLSRPVGARMIGHTAPVERVAYRPDGRVVATVSGDNTARLWNVADPLRPKSAGVVKGHTKGLTAAAFSANGRVLATGSADETARLWEVSDTGQPRALSTVKGHEQPVGAVAFNPKGDLLATAGADESVRLWNIADTAKPQAVAVLKQDTTPTDVAFSPDGRMLAVTSAGGVALLDVLTPAKPASLASLKPTDGGGVTGVAFSANGQNLVTASTTGALHVWNIATARVIGTATGHASAVRDVAFSPDGNVLASASADGTARLWDVTSPNSPRAAGILNGFAGAVTGVAFGANGQNLATSSADGTARMWNVADPAEVAARARLTGHTALVNGLTIAKSGRTLATVSGDKTIKLWDVADPAAATPVATLRGHTAAVVSAAFSPDGRHLVSASLDRTARMWDVSTPASPKLVSTLQGHTGGLRSAVYSGSGALVATTGQDGRTLVWDVSAASSPKRLALPDAADDRLTAAAFRPDGRMLATGSGTASVRLWDLSDRAKPRLAADFSAHAAGVLDLQFSRDGKALATTASDGTARLWDVTRPEQPKRLSILQGHLSDVAAVAFSADGRSLATASRDRTIRVWNIANRAQPSLWAVFASPYAVDDVEFGADGTFLAATSDTAAQLWGLDVEQATATTCETSGMSITRAEWAQYIPGRPYSLPCPAQN